MFIIMLEIALKNKSEHGLKVVVYCSVEHMLGGGIVGYACHCHYQYRCLITDLGIFPH